jgi:hypothetical protein
MKYRVTAAAALLLSACTSLNPNYNPNGVVPDGGVGPGSDGGTGNNKDSGTPGDLAAVCKDTQRQCLATTGSAACVSGQYMLDRKCPMGSMCKTGYCQPPAMSFVNPTGNPCDVAGGPQENQCFSQVTDTLSCQPFVTDPANKSVSWICATSVGMGLPGAPCTDGSTCRTGFCGSNGTCFRACQLDTDCPVQTNGTRYNCREVTITVEGVAVKQTSCIP